MSREFEYIPWLKFVIFFFFYLLSRKPFAKIKERKKKKDKIHVHQKISNPRLKLPSVEIASTRYNDAFPNHSIGHAR